MLVGGDVVVRRERYGQAADAGLAFADPEVRLVRRTEAGVPAKDAAQPAGDGAVFRIATMDCAAEESEIRTALAKVSGVRGMTFQLGARTVRIEPATNRTYHYWHTFVPGVRPGQLYGYRASGAFEPSQGQRFDPTKVLLDPYGRGVVVPKGYTRAAAKHNAGDNAARSTAKNLPPSACATPIPAPENAKSRAPAIARATHPSPVPAGPVISVGKSPIFCHNTRRYRRKSLEHDPRQLWLPFPEAE